MNKKPDKRGATFKTGWQFFITIVLVVMAGLYIKYFMFEEIVPDGRSLSEFPGVVGVWENTARHQLADDVLDILKVDEYVLRDFRNNDGSIASLYIGYYKTHRKSVEIHTPEHCQVGGGWEILSKKERKVDIPGIEGKMMYIEAVYEKDQEKRVFLYWYYINGKYITDFFKYKISIIMNSLFYHRSDASFIRITVPVKNEDVNSAIRSGESFLKEAVPVINNYLSF